MAQIDSRWQIFLHDISIEKTTQLTNKDNNVNPQISGNYVVWEGIREGAWQVLMFDGIKITQLTQGDTPKQDVVIEGNTIAYSQKEGDVWQVYLFDIVDETFTKVSDQNSARNPVIEQELVTWESFNDEGEVYFEYDMKDKKLKKLAKKVERFADIPVETIAVVEPVEPQPIPEPVTKEDIIEELDLVEIVEVPETPESTPSSEEAPSLEDLLNLEDTEESTASGD
jgi:beta propeller repeat protein